MQQNNSTLFYSSYHQCAILASVSCASRARYESRNMKSINKHSAASLPAIRLIGCARSMPRHSLFAPISKETYARMLLFQYGENRSNESLAWWEAAERDCQLPMLFFGPSFGCLHKKPFSVTNQSYRYRYSGAEWDGGTLPAALFRADTKKKVNFPLEIRLIASHPAFQSFSLVTFHRVNRNRSRSGLCGIIIEWNNQTSANWKIK